MLGLRKAKELLMAGRFIDGKEAERIDLVNRAVPRDQLEAETWKLAKEFENCQIAARFDDLTLRIATTIDDYVVAHPDTTRQQVRMALANAMDAVEASEEHDLCAPFTEETVG